MTPALPFNPTGMTQAQALATYTTLNAQYLALISGQSPSEIVADGYVVRNSRADLDRLEALLLSLQAIAYPGRPRGGAIGIRF